MKKEIPLIIITCFLQFTSLSQGSWKTITSPSFDASFYGIDASFINDSVGFVASVGGVIYKTTDRGETWDSLSHVPGYTRSMEFINDTIGFVGNLEAMGSSPGSLCRTLDGGISWTMLTNMQMNLYDGICGIATYGNTVVATGTYSIPPWFYRSDDFGASWSKSDLSAQASGLIDCYMYSSDTILITGSADAANNYRGVIFKSVDGGNTWQQVFISSRPSTYCWKIFMRPSGKGIASIQTFINDTLKAAVTNDFGNTWQEVNIAPSNPFNLWMAGVCFLNDTLGWISSEYDGPTFQTTNGGLTWDTALVVRAVNRFVVLDSVTVVAPGNQSAFSGVIYKYDQTTTGVEENGSIKKYEPNTLTIYPNPAKNYIDIKAEAAINSFGLMRIVDAKGYTVNEVTRQLFKKGITRLKQKISLPPGNYYLLWFTNNMMLSKKFEVIK